MNINPTIVQKRIEKIAFRKELTRREIEASYYRFFLYFWDVLVQETLVRNWHLKYVCYELQTVAERLFKRLPSLYDLIINVSPGTSKTSLATILFPAWLWVRDPTLRIISGSYSADLAIEHSVKTRDILKSEKFRDMFPDLIEFKADQDNKSRYENTSGGARISTSTGGAATGRHGHIILIDDPVNPKKAASDVERQSANDWINKTLSNRKVDKKLTPTILIMQRLHDDDPTGNLMEKRGNVRRICLPAEITDLDNVEPRELAEYYVDGLFDPVRMDRETLSRERAVLGSIEYTGQYLQSPRSAEGNIFKREWFRYYDELPAGKPLRKFQSWDTAVKEKTTADFTVMTEWSQFETGLYLTDFFMDRIDYPKLKAQIRLKNESGRPHNILVEDKSSGQQIIQEMRNLNVPLVAITPDGDKILRANQASPTFESRNVYFPISEYTETITDQLCGFPNTKNDDIVDSITQAINWAREKPTSLPFIVSKSRRLSSKFIKQEDRKLWRGAKKTKGFTGKRSRI